MNYLSVQRIRESKGQGMVEYIIIVALIAISAIGVFSLFGKGIRGQMGEMTAELSGQNQNNTTAKNAATDARDLAKKKNDLGNYGESASKSTESQK